MNKKISLLTITLLVLAALPIILAIPLISAVSIGGPVNPIINPEEFAPQVWMCDNRVVYDDNTEPGRITLGGEELIEREHNYAFEGEKITWDVLVMDKNGIQKVKDVFSTIGYVQSNGGGTGTVTRTGTITSCDNIPSRNTNWADNLVLDKFNGNLGNLLNVEIELNTEMINSINIQNQDTGPIIVTLDSNGNVNINPIDGPTVASTISISENLSANQGVNLFNISDTDSKSYIANNLSMYITSIGDTTFNLPTNASATAQLSGSGNFLGGVSTQASAQACVTYTYEYEVNVSTGSDIEANCYEKVNPPTTVIPECNARILEENLTGRPINTMTQRYYTCELTVETPESMYGEYWMTVEAVDLDGLSGTMDENEYWFLNPVIALSIDGDLEFDNVRPGTSSYSSTLLVGNDADVGSGVMLDMFITGTDFYDSSNSGAACPTTNQLSLHNFRYFATNGAYDTIAETRAGGSLGGFTADPEGYMNVPYGIGFNDPNPFYGNAEIIPTAGNDRTDYSPGNILSPGNEMAITFKLELPEPCNGNFDSGALYFWGEAI